MCSDYGEHNIIIYPDNYTLRNIYSGYCKSLFENTNKSSSNYDEEMVLIIPNYETIQGIKFTLEKRAGINVQKPKKNCSLVIVDFRKAYSCLNNNKATYNIMSRMGSFLEQVEYIGKKGIIINF